MPDYPPALRFCSLLQYSSKGTSEYSKLSRIMRNGIKNDGFIPIESRGVEHKQRALEWAAETLDVMRHEYPFLQEAFDRSVVVPMPSSSLYKEGNLWCPLQICRCIADRGLSSRPVPLLRRIRPIPKAAFAASLSDRPKPQDHYESVRVEDDLLIGDPAHLTVVDDFITTGCSFVGVYPRLREAFPNSQIRFFALVRTISFRQDVSDVYSPIQGKIMFSGHGHPDRHDTTQ
jgi:hypothetical protein